MHKSTWTAIITVIVFLKVRPCNLLTWSCYPECFYEYRNMSNLMNNGNYMNFTNAIPNSDVVIVKFVEKTKKKHNDSDRKSCYIEKDLHIRYDKSPVEIHYNADSVKIPKLSGAVRDVFHAKHKPSEISHIPFYAVCRFRLGEHEYTLKGGRYLYNNMDNTYTDMITDRFVEHRFMFNYRCVNIKGFVVMYDNTTYMVINDLFEVVDFGIRKNRIDILILYDSRFNTLFFAKENGYCVLRMPLCNTTDIKVFSKNVNRIKDLRLVNEYVSVIT